MSSLDFQENVPLKQYSTMRLGGTARYAVTVMTEDELLEAVKWARSKQLKFKAIGGGSNIVWRDAGFDGLLIIMDIVNFELLPGNQVRIGAGLEWDEAVQKTVEAGLSGVEFLSFIPGTTGATPVQNVGAYGQEISNVLVSVRALDNQTNEFVEISNAECNFAYRTSRFKTTDSGRFIITSVTLQLSAEPPNPPFYDSLQAYLDEHKIKDYTPQTIRDAVIAIRTERLPDPFETANNGSFFANPIITDSKYQELLANYPDIKAWPIGKDRVKIAAAWLIEQAGFKNFHDPETGMATWDKQALVLINVNAKSTDDLLKFKQKIVDAVKDKFDITLEQEPELLP